MQSKCHFSYWNVTLIFLCPSYIRLKSSFHNMIITNCLYLNYRFWSSFNLDFLFLFIPKHQHWPIVLHPADCDLPVFRRHDLQGHPHLTNGITNSQFYPLLPNVESGDSNQSDHGSQIPCVQWLWPVEELWPDHFAGSRWSSSDVGAMVGLVEEAGGHSSDGAGKVEWNVTCGHGIAQESKIYFHLISYKHLIWPKREKWPK